MLLDGSVSPARHFAVMAIDPALTTFVRDLPEERADLVRDIHQVIAEHAPDLIPPVLDGATLAYGPYHYRYASGREGDAHLITIRNGAKHLSAYVAAKQGASYIAEANADKLGNVSVGRSCIRIRRRGDLDLGALSEVVRAAAAAGGEGQQD
jgi:hypothetical protein